MKLQVSEVISLCVKNHRYSNFLDILVLSQHVSKIYYKSLLETLLHLGLSVEGVRLLCTQMTNVTEIYQCKFLRHLRELVSSCHQKTKAPKQNWPCEFIHLSFSYLSP